MEWTVGNGTFPDLVDVLVEEAVTDAGVPRSLAERARFSTVRNLGHLGDEPLDGVSIRRVRHYFSSATRRISAHAEDPDVKRYRRRAVVASIAADLREAGMEESRVIAEVAACVGPDAPEMLRAG